MMAFNTPPSLSTLSSLPPLREDLKQLYVVLSPSHRTIFRRIYQYLYKYLTGAKEYEQDFNFLTYYFLIYSLLKEFDELNDRRLAVLSWMWWMTGGGVHALNTAVLNLNSLQYREIKYFADLGYLRRTKFDPALPYSIKLRRDSFVSFTSDGVAFYKRVLNHYNSLVLAFHGSDWNDRKRKP